MREVGEKLSLAMLCRVSSRILCRFTSRSDRFPTFSFCCSELTTCSMSSKTTAVGLGLLFLYNVYYY